MCSVAITLPLQDIKEAGGGARWERWWFLSSAITCVQSAEWDNKAACIVDRGEKKHLQKTDIS